LNLRKGERLKEKTIKKEQIGKWLEKLGKDYEIWAPVKKNGLVLFHPIVAAKEVFLDFSNSIKTPKDLFFPQSEVLFSFPEEGVEKEGETVLQKPRIIFAIRPCDAQSLALLDRVFDSEDYQDPYYVQRREGTLLLGMACTRPERSCFCTSLGGGPFEKTHLDLLIADLGDGKYFVEALTQGGEDLMGKDGCLQEAQEKDREKLASSKEEAEKKVKSKIVTDDWTRNWTISLIRPCGSGFTRDVLAAVFAPIFVPPATVLLSWMKRTRPESSGFAPGILVCFLSLPLRPQGTTPGFPTVRE